MAIHLAPATRENIEKSLENPVPVELVSDYILDDFLQDLQAKAGLEGIRCWAMTESHRKTFERMQPGDDVLFSTKGTGKFTHYGQVIAKLENKALGDALWPFVGQKSWNLIYFLRNIYHLDFWKKDIVTNFGYKPNFDVPDFIRVDESRFNGHFAHVLEQFGIDVRSDDLDEVALSEPMEELATQPAWKMDQIGEDVVGRSKRRKGHRLFEQMVKGLYGWSCAITGIKERPFLVAGHIIPWATAADLRVNPANGICLSVFYDRALEKGYFTLDNDHNILVSPLVEPATPLGLQLLPVAGQKIRLPKSYPPTPEILQRHRDEIFKKG